MAEKISNELAERLEDLRRTGSDDKVSVIVTLKPGIDKSVVQGAGLTVENVLDNISAVSGSASISVVNRMAQLDEVEVIEFDGEMRAL